MLPTIYAEPQREPVGDRGDYRFHCRQRRMAVISHICLQEGAEPYCPCGLGEGTQNPGTLSEVSKLSQSQSLGQGAEKSKEPVLQVKEMRDN